MALLHRLLAATDFSPPVRHAAERAALVSRESGAALELFHVANLAPLERLRQLMMETPDALEQRVLDAARTRLGELAAALHQRYGTAAATHVAAGALLAELTYHAQALAPSLIVCGATAASMT